jgi:uncharacterized protein (TIGR03382 family)
VKSRAFSVGAAFAQAGGMRKTTALGESRFSGLLAALAIVAVPQLAFGYGSGITGYSGKTAGMVCNNCHSGGPPPTVTLTGPTTLKAGEVGQYTANAVVAAGGRVSFVGGIDVATDNANAVLAATTPTTEVRSGELTHNQGIPYAKSGGGGGEGNGPTAFSLSIPFTMQAPSTGGTVTMYIEMMAGAGQAAPTPDYGTPITFKVTVDGPDGGAPAAGTTGGTTAGGTTGGGTTGGGTTGGVGGGGTPTDDGGVPANGDNGGMMPMDMGQGGHGCSFASGTADAMGFAGLAVAALLLGLFRRRRA